MINKKLIVLILINILSFSQNSIARESISMGDYCETTGLWGGFQKCEKFIDVVFDKSEKYLYVLKNKNLYYNSGSYNTFIESGIDVYNIDSGSFVFNFHADVEYNGDWSNDTMRVNYADSPINLQFNYSLNKIYVNNGNNSRKKVFSVNNGKLKSIDNDSTTITNSGNVNKYKCEIKGSNIKVYSKSKNKSISLNAQDNGIYGIKFSPSGKYLVSIGNYSRDLFLWKEDEYGYEKIALNQKQAEKKYKEYLSKVGKWRKTIKSGDYCSYGLIIDVKGEVIKVQTTDSIANNYTQWEDIYDYDLKKYIRKPKTVYSSNSVSVEKWFKRSDLYPN